MAYITQNTPAFSWSLLPTLRVFLKKFQKPLHRPSRLTGLSPRQLRDIGLTPQDAAEFHIHSGPANCSMDVAQRIRLQSMNW